MAFPVATSQTG